MKIGNILNIRLEDWRDKMTADKVNTLCPDDGLTCYRFCDYWHHMNCVKVYMMRNFPKSKMFEYC